MLATGILITSAATDTLLYKCGTAPSSTTAVKGTITVNLCNTTATPVAVRIALLAGTSPAAANYLFSHS